MALHGSAKTFILLSMISFLSSFMRSCILQEKASTLLIYKYDAICSIGETHHLVNIHGLYLRMKIAPF